MTFNPGPYLKAIVAGTLAGLGTLYAAQADGVITGQEWTQVAIYTISAAAAIYGVPNTPAKQDNTPQQSMAPSYLPPAPATQWPAAAIAALPAPPAGYPEPGTTPADTAALAASAAARQGVGA